MIKEPSCLHLRTNYYLQEVRSFRLNCLRLSHHPVPLFYENSIKLILNNSEFLVLKLDFKKNKFKVLFKYVDAYLNNSFRKERARVCGFNFRISVAKDRVKTAQ